MKKIVFIVFYIFNSLQAQVDVLSLKSYTCDDEIALPVVIINSENQNCLTIEFDLKAEVLPNIAIIFRFCDVNWFPYNNPFLENRGKNSAYNLEYSFLPVTVSEAKYHYKLQYPDARGYVEFPFSGKWKFFITDYNDTSKVYAEGKFYVVIPSFFPKVKLQTEILSDKEYFPADLARTLNLSTSFNLPEEFFPLYVDGVEIVENQLVNYPIYVDRKTTSSEKYYSWDGNRNFTFTSREMKPGNEYRQVDLRNENLYNSKSVKAQIDGLELSRFYKLGNPDLNGGSMLVQFSKDYAEYLNVTFSIRPPENITGDIFITGSFNNWEVAPEFRLNNENGLYSKTLLLKRGLYDYQYVTGQLEHGRVTNINRTVLEGNFLETNNIYSCFVFYKDPEYGGYDKIIGYTKIKSR
ncbi:MAG TPA: hypothetical protein PK397_06670 [Ignavibacteriaceae bacterium]|nr:hypothetical protein [Ignavibacteriaceae bacterium]